MAILKSFIYLISSSLLGPVLLLLAGLTIWLLVYSGSFVSIWLQRRRLAGQGEISDLLSQSTPLALSGAVGDFVQGLAEIRDQKRAEIMALNLLRESEHLLWQSLDPLKMLIRIGPGLGLIGTLIPMGTGLAALGQGDLSRLSGDLVIAFTTTVVGMTLGLLSYFFFTIQRRWVEEDVKNMELAAEIIMAES